jgi:alpha-tubulin suppressor-like RCC1 family protein
MIKKNLKVLQLFLLFPALAFFTSYCKKDDIPVEKEELSLPIVAIAAGYSHSLALTNDGTLWAWGLNENGQVGDSTWLNSVRKKTYLFSKISYI